MRVPTLRAHIEPFTLERQVAERNAGGERERERERERVRERERERDHNEYTYRTHRPTYRTAFIA